MENRRLKTTTAKVPVALHRRIAAYAKASGVNVERIVADVLEEGMKQKKLIDRDYDFREDKSAYQ